MTSALDDNSLINSLHKVQMDRFQTLTPQQKSSLVDFFNPRNMSKEELEWLSHLPLFQLTNDSFDSIHRHLHKHRIYMESKKNALPHYPTGIKMLKKKNRNDKMLYMAMGVKKAKDLLLYKDFILHDKSFHELSDQEQFLHLNHIMNQPNLRSALQQKIKELKFLNNKTPSQCYDPSNECFKLFLQDDANQFPRHPYNTPEWLMWLKNDLGLISKVTTEFILEYGNTIRDKDANIARYKATVLLDQLYDSKTNSLVFDNVTFLKQVSNMKIIPIMPLDDALYLHNMNNKHVNDAQDNCLQSISNCVNIQYVEITFTSTCVYDPIYEQAIDAIVHRINQHITPKTSWVMDHLINISKMNHFDLQVLNHGTERVQSICNHIYQYLHKQSKSTLPPINTNQHQLIYVNGYFLYASTLFWKMDCHYAPYVYKVPDHYFEFVKLFESWGVKDKPSSDFCYHVLKQFRVRCKSDAMSISEIDLCIRLIRLLCDDSHSLVGSFLVSDRGCLCPHRSVLIDDAPFLRSRINVNRLDLLHPDLVDLSSKLELRTLSAVVRERLITMNQSSSSMQQHTPQTLRITDNLRGTHFVPALIRLARHSCGAADGVIPFERISELSSFTCCQVDQIQCVYIDSRDERDVTLRGTDGSAIVESGTMCVVDADALRIYVSKRLPNYLDPYVVVARSINQHLGNMMHDTTTIIALMLKCDVTHDNMDRILDDFHVTDVSGGATNLNRRIGERVLEQDLSHFVACTPNVTKLSIGELIAYLDVNTISQQVVMRYGRIHKKLDNGEYVIEKSNQSFITIHVDHVRKFMTLAPQQDEKAEQELLNHAAPIATDNQKVLHDVLSNMLICPITQEIFTEPVILSDGNTYEKEAILKWLVDHNTSPITREKLSSRVMVPNYMIQSLIREYIDCD
ncbi:hypothetical protein AKO1_006471 [Acrasis kona]|uniref:U-box domain-containing protein n=1 Tax=Acrasis kona TaxID=1008807 RepID=A0AAW2YLK4_9EUKA